MNSFIVGQSSQSDSTNKILELDMMQGIENDIKEKIEAMWKAGYSYVIICEYATNALGIQRATNIMKAIAQVQNILDKINGDLNQLKKLLEELEKLGFPQKWYYKNDKGQWVQSNQNFDPSKGSPKYKPKDWGKGSVWATPSEQMSFAIQAWLKQSNDLGIDGPNGKPLSNEQAMQYIWKDLYGEKGDDKGGLLAQLQAALNNPWYKQTDNGAAKTLAALNGNALFGGDTNSKIWNNPWDTNQTFLDFLRGGKFQVSQVAEMLQRAVTDSYYKNNNMTPPKDKGVKVEDDIGEVTSNMDSVVQSSTAMNSTESADLSMFSQQLTSLINIVQQMLQQNDKSNTTMTNNQIAR